jgi:hypothetical protein
MAFTVPLSKIGLRVQAQIEDKVRQRTHALFRKIVLRTPVYTGRARANWNVSLGRANYSVTNSTNEARALTQVDKVLSLPVGSKIFLTNGVPYIRVLEYGGYPLNPKHPSGRSDGGFSTQAPAGMVRISVLEFGGTIGKGN